MDFTDFLQTYVTNHYGLDWAAAITGLISVWRLGSRHKDGFIWGIISSLFWAAFNIHVTSAAGILFNIFFAAFHLRGLISWAREHRSMPTSPAGQPADQAPTSRPS